jgi:hypothetical protein
VSAALYKFLRKAVMNGEPGAERLLGNMTRSARHDILHSLAQVKPAGELDHGFMLSEELPWLGDNAKEMLRETRRALRFDNEPVRDTPTLHEARRMYNDWTDASPWRRK